MSDDERRLFAAWEAQFAANDGTLARAARGVAVGLGTATALLLGAVLSAGLAVAALTGLAGAL